MFESIKTEDTPIIVERVVADIDENVVAIVRKFKDAFKSITAQREIKRNYVLFCGLTTRLKIKKFLIRLISILRCITNRLIK